MKKIGLGLLTLAVFAVLGTTGGYGKAEKSAGLFLTNAYAQAPAPTAAPAKKVVAKWIHVKGTITAIDEKALTFTLHEANAAAAITFKVNPEMIKKLTVGEKVVVGYKTMPCGKKYAVYVGRDIT